MTISRKSIPGRGDSMCKGPEVGTCWPVRLKQGEQKGEGEETRCERS